MPRAAEGRARRIDRDEAAAQEQVPVSDAFRPVASDHVAPIVDAKGGHGD